MTETRAIEDSEKNKNANLHTLISSVAEVRAQRIEELGNPSWGQPVAPEWTKHVPQSIQSLWDSLSLEAKIVAYVYSESLACEDES
jgi:hypothetical protein